MKKLLLFIALVVASLALQACKPECIVSVNGSIAPGCPIPGTVIPGE